MDQEKTTFTCPFGIYAYRRMPFGLSNAPATFQRCMLAIFHDMIEESIEVFMDDFSIFGNSFDKCLNNLDKMLQHCKNALLVLNWEKCHFMVKEGIMLGHKVSGAGLEVDKAKIDVISKLPPPTNIKEFDIEIQDRKGTENVATDHLSRIAITRQVMTGIDFMGPFPKSYKYEYILVVVDYIFKWAKAQALPTSDARVDITFLKQLFCHFKMPKALISDQVENTNRALKRILEKTVKDNPAIWLRKLDDDLWDFRTTYKTPTGATPYKLIYGKNCHLPFKIEHRAYRALKNCNPDLIAAGEKRMFQLHELDELRHQAYENSRLYKARTKVWHDKKLRMRKEFKHGNHSKYKFKQPKLRSHWLGPYVVKHQYLSEYVELYGKGGKTFIVNGHRLKLYHKEEDYIDQREAVTPFFPNE
ncbi:reverse transcriptase domain-containing protein [Tanacetum coccineum]|uniref:Reverse transcriptase domain-containing protein n=1 Tax=Tanacetum coccineum TaxID=301880 RepID=A0ABQ5F253_9ASTR